MADAKVFDRVKETTTTTGSAGVFALGGAVTGYRAYGDVATNTDMVFYVIEDDAGNWEVGAGVFSSGDNTITRDWIDDSSNGGSAVDWPAGTKRIFCELPAEYHVVLGNWQQHVLESYLYWTGSTSDDTPTAMERDTEVGTAPISTCVFSLLIRAVGSAGVKAWTAQVVMEPGFGIVGTPTPTPIAGTTGTEGWDVAFSESAGELVITVTGDASSTVNWVASATVL